MTGGIVLGIRLRFRHTPEQAAVVLAFYQPAANQLRSNDLRWTAEKAGAGVRSLGEALGDYGVAYVSDAYQV